MTEASHLRTLRVLDLIFYQRMKKEGLLPREELARLFPNLPELIEIHSEEPAPPPPSLASLQVPALVSPAPHPLPEQIGPASPLWWENLMFSLKPAFQLPHK